MGRYIFWRAAIAPVAIAGLMAVVAAGVASQSDDTYGQTTLRIRRNWKTGEVVFSLQEPLVRHVQPGGGTATAAYSANRRWQTQFDRIIPYVLRHISYDSTETVFSAAANRDIGRRTTERAGRQSVLIYNGLSEDFISVEARYRLRLHPAVASLFPPSTQGVRGYYDWVASRDYSGVVVVAQGALPIHGDTGRAAAQTDAVSRYLRPAVAYCHGGGDG